MPQSLGYSYGLWSGFSRFGIARKINEIFTLRLRGCYISPYLSDPRCGRCSLETILFWDSCFVGFQHRLAVIGFQTDKKRVEEGT